MSFAFRCQVCDGDRAWTVRRVGDAVTSWACADDLALVCEGLQRDYEVTELQVTFSAKATEVAGINRMLQSIIDEPQ